MNLVNEKVGYIFIFMLDFVKYEGSMFKKLLWNDI